MSKDALQDWELISGYIHKELTISEEEQHHKLLADKNYQRNFKGTQKINNSLKRVFISKKSHKNKSWNNIQSQISKNKVRSFAYKLSRYAAVIILTLASTFLINHYSKKVSAQQTYAEIEILPGQTGHLFLFDGTEVWLNSDSRLKYPNTFNKSNREVILSGEAFFKVTPNKSLPFIVKSKELQVQVLGTSFNISAYDQDQITEVVLVEGKVQLNNSNGDKLVNLAPGEMASKKVKNRVVVQKINPEKYISWKDGKISFQAETMGNIAKKLERWYNVRILFQDEQLKSLNFSGTILRNKPIDQTIMALELLAPIQFEYKVIPDAVNIITIKRKHN